MDKIKRAQLVFWLTLILAVGTTILDALSKM